MCTAAAHARAAGPQRASRQAVRCAPGTRGAWPRGGGRACRACRSIVFVHQWRRAERHTCCAGAARAQRGGRSSGDAPCGSQWAARRCHGRHPGSRRTGRSWQRGSGCWQPQRCWAGRLDGARVYGQSVKAVEEACQRRGSLWLGRAPGLATRRRLQKQHVRKRQWVMLPTRNVSDRDQ